MDDRAAPAHCLAVTAIFLASAFIAANFASFAVAIGAIPVTRLARRLAPARRLDAEAHGINSFTTARSAASYSATSR